MTAEESLIRARSVWIRWFSGATVLLAALAVYPLSQVTPPLRTGALWGWLVAFVLCAPSGWLAIWSLSRSLKTFLLVTFGGMTIRLGVVGALIVVTAVLGLVDPTAFACGILIPYVLYQALEIVTVHRHRPAQDPTAVSS